MLHSFTQLGLQEKKNLLSCHPHSKTHHTAPKTGFVDRPNSLEACFFLFVLFCFKSDFLACFPRFWLGMSGVGPRNLHLLEESSYLNRNYSQTSGHSLMGHSNPAFKPWSHCRADAQFQAALFELTLSHPSDGVCCLLLRNRIKWNHLYKGGARIK